MTAAPARNEPSWLDSDGAFKFLEHFTEEDEAIFAGRDREIQIIVAGILRAPSLVLYGGSGTGKTSLLCAGLFPRLRRQNLRPVYVRTLSDPLADLRCAILDELSEVPESGAVPDLLAALTADKPALLVFDQFEEFFLRFRDRPDLRQAFIETLGAIVNDRRLAVKLLFSLRQEYLGELDDLRRHLPRLLDNEYRLPRLSAFGARRSIACQLQRAGVPFERRFLTRVVDLLDEYRFDPTVLQILCSEVYRQALRSGRDPLKLTAADVDEVGDLRLLFWRHLDQMARSLPPGRRLTARAVLDALIGGEQTRRAADFATLYEESIRSTDPDEIREVLEVLRGNRLVHADDQGQECWYELTHDRLVPVVREWLERDQHFRELRTARQLVANTARGGHWRRDPELLLTDHQLERVVAPVREHLPLTSDEIEFLLKSAIFRGSRDDAVYWSARYGPEGGRRLVLEMLEGDDPKAVLGAARVARHVGDEGGALARACARRTVGAPDEAVAAEAFFSLLELTGSRRASRRLLQEALAEREKHRERLDLTHRLYRWARFRWCLVKSRRHAARQAMSPEYRGLKARSLDVLGAAILWCFLVGPAVYLAGAWPTGDLELSQLRDVAEGIGSLTPAVSLIALVLAFGLTYAVGRSLGRVRPTWPLVVRWSAAVPALFLAPVILVAAFLMDTGEGFGLGLRIAVAFALIVALALALWILFWLASLLVKAGGAVFRPGDPEYKIWGWSLAASCSLPILVPVLVFCVPAWIAALGSDKAAVYADDAAILAVVWALALSFLTFIFYQMLARSGLPPALEPVADDRRRRVRKVTLAVLAINVFGWLAFEGLDSVRFLAPRCSVEAYDVLAGDNACSSDHLGPGFPDADYRKVTLPGKAALLRLTRDSVASLEGVHASLESIDLGDLSEHDLLALPATGALQPSHELSIGPTESFDSLWRKWTLQFEVLDVLSDRQPEATRSGRGSERGETISETWTYWWTELERTGIECRAAAAGSRLDPQLVARCAYVGRVPGSPPQTREGPWMVELIVFRHQLAFGTKNVNYPVMVHTRGQGDGWRPAGRGDPQNCAFSNVPVVNATQDDRERWKIPVCPDGSWSARIQLGVDAKDADKVPFLAVGVRRVPADGSAAASCAPAGPAAAARGAT